MARFERRNTVDPSRPVERKKPVVHSRTEEPIASETKLKTPKFRVKWDGKYIDILEISGLIRTTEVLLYRAGLHPNRNLRSPGVTYYEPIVLTRRRTHDSDFEKWVNKVYNWQGGTGTEVSLKDFRKDIIIDIFNNKGQKTMSFMVFQCWPSEYSALDPLTVTQNDDGLEILTLEHEGFMRDYEVVPPQ